MTTPELHWFKSSYSDSSNPSDCVEIAATHTRIHIRDSKIPQTPPLTVTPTTWNSFVAFVAES